MAPKNRTGSRPQEHSFLSARLSIPKHPKMAVGDLRLCKLSTSESGLCVLYTLHVRLDGRPCECYSKKSDLCLSGSAQSPNSFLTNFIGLMNSIATARRRTRGLDPERADTAQACKGSFYLEHFRGVRRFRAYRVVDARILWSKQLPATWPGCSRRHFDQAFLAYCSHRYPQKLDFRP